MRSKPMMVLIGLVVAATLLFSGSGMAVAQDSGGQVGAQACVAPCLYDQLRLDQANGWVSQNFETALNTADNQAADDFAIPPGSFFWLVNKIEVDGFYQQPPSGYAAVSVNVFFYNSSVISATLSLPGTSSYQGSFVPSDCPSPYTAPECGNFTINLNPPAGLLAGRTYWVSVQANLDLGGAGHVWYWGRRGPPQDPTTGNSAAWINRGGEFTPEHFCTNWGPLATCGDPGTTTDLQFKLSGSQINIAATVYLPLVSR